MTGLDPAQPGAIYTATSWQGEIVHQTGVRDRGSVRDDIELEVLGRRDLADDTTSPGETDVLHSTRRKAKCLSELNPISRFWHSHVHLSVEHKACRDHLGTFVWLNRL